ncbi:hypothetical protein AB0A74_34995 [Saccharothrix sp. NPDC042600]|uniref:hypothetical protein n=1 Tax=Saccharothrix TaxID=2071 RepID=UPI0033F0F772|nr:hypothetical protein GCM10017745_33310 [Saccharothrix mutabilis subsp. capreolus]
MNNPDAPPVARSASDVEQPVRRWVDYVAPTEHAEVIFKVAEVVAPSAAAEASVPGEGASLQVRYRDAHGDLRVPEREASRMLGLAGFGVGATCLVAGEAVLLRFGADVVPAGALVALCVAYMVVVGALTWHFGFRR